MPVSADWVTPGAIKHIRFDTQGDQEHMVLVMSHTFHNCGWNHAANINPQQVGAQVYHIMRSEALAARQSRVALSLEIDGCIGNQAQVINMQYQ